MSIPLVPQLLRSHLKELADNGQRLDGRTQYQGRDVELEVNVLGNAEGSARVRMGDTIVFAGVKFQTMTPYSDRPNEGGLMCMAEVRPVAGRQHEAGPPSAESIELSRVVDRGIRESGCIERLYRCQGSRRCLPEVTASRKFLRGLQHLLRHINQSALHRLDTEQLGRVYNGRKDQSRLCTSGRNQRALWLK